MWKRHRPLFHLMKNKIFYCCWRFRPFRAKRKKTKKGFLTFTLFSSRRTLATLILGFSLDRRRIYSRSGSRGRNRGSGHCLGLLLPRFNDRLRWGGLYLGDELLRSIYGQVYLLLGFNELKMTARAVSGVRGLLFAAVMHQSRVLLGLGLVERVELRARVTFVRQKRQVHDEHVLEHLLLVKAEIRGAQVGASGRFVQSGHWCRRTCVALAVTQATFERVAVVHKLHFHAWRHVTRCVDARRLFFLNTNSKIPLIWV